MPSASFFSSVAKREKPVIPVAEHIHLRAGAGIEQLLEGGHIVGKRPQQRLSASAVGEDLRDMCVDGLCESGSAVPSTAYVSPSCPMW